MSYNAPNSGRRWATVNSHLPIHQWLACLGPSVFLGVLENIAKYCQELCGCFEEYRDLYERGSLIHIAGDKPEDNRSHAVDS